MPVPVVVAVVVGPKQKAGLLPAAGAVGAVVVGPNEKAGLLPVAVAVLVAAAGVAKE